MAVINEIRKADPGARRRAILVVVLGAAVGGLLIAGFEHFREPFRDWLISDPAETARREKLAIYASVVVLCVPVMAAAAYFWLLGAKVLRAQQFPPPGFRVIRDTPVIDGRGAVTRGHVLQVVAVCQGLGAAGLCWFLLWLVGTLA